MTTIEGEVRAAIKLYGQKEYERGQAVAMGLYPCNQEARHTALEETVEKVMDATDCFEDCSPAVELKDLPEVTDNDRIIQDCATRCDKYVTEGGFKTDVGVSAKRVCEYVCQVLEEKDRKKK